MLELGLSKLDLGEGANDSQTQMAVEMTAQLLGLFWQKLQGVRATLSQAV